MPRKLKNLSGRIVSRTGALPGFRLFAIVCALGFVGYCVYALAEGFDPASAVIACALLFVFLVAFIYLCLNPDSLRSQYTEQALSTASEMLDIIKSGLDRESAEAICRRLLPETRAMAIAVTDEEHVLACVGELEVDFPPGSPIHTPATRYVLDHGVAQSFTHMVDVRSERTEHRAIPAGIIVPLKVRDKAVGTLKFYYRRSHDVNRTQYALASGFAELLSTQLAIHELELQDELTARAELRALQAQINPHFLYNTLDAIVWLAESGSTDEVVHITRALSDFFRISLSQGRDWIEVAEELKHLRGYLTIQKVRYRDILDYEIDVPEEAQEGLILKLLLQPLVENAIYHGIKFRRRGGKVRVVGRREGEQLHFAVIDNGPGMTEERLLEVIDGLGEEDTSAGYGLSNVDRRIRLYYGIKQGLRIHSDSEGTRVEFTLPVRRQADV